jgi:hypothetical protein
MHDHYNTFKASSFLKLRFAFVQPRTFLLCLLQREKLGTGDSLSVKAFEARAKNMQVLFLAVLRLLLSSKK